MEETRVCKSKTKYCCGKELPVSEFYTRHTHCKTCHKKYTIDYKIKNSEACLVAKIKNRYSSKGKLAHNRRQQRYRATHPQSYINTYRIQGKLYKDRLGYGYVHQIWKIKNPDIPFTNEIWLKEKIRIQAVRRLREIKNQLNLK